ncbi:MAG: hypothetical protein KAI29_24310 [Cyclobacteriaceae bacterium]|nr:hypothetical protein [Cyclobacteriaceae bacterium]
MNKPPLAKLASAKLSLFLLLLVIIFSVVIMPFSTGNKKAKPIDIHFAYSPEKVYELIHSDSDATRKSYIIGEMTLDVIYPVASLVVILIALLAVSGQSFKAAMTNPVNSLRDE